MQWASHLDRLVNHPHADWWLAIFAAAVVALWVLGTVFCAPSLG